jgi:hypothetical protein
MGKVGFRERNPNWKGGRVVDPRGYVLIRVGTDHPLADVRGYAYEHRLKMFEAGKLKPDKKLHVHHGKDGLVNSEENLEVLTPWAHRAKHRTRTDKWLQDPDTPNFITSCECGCGAQFEKYDAQHRSRRFISGHNLHGRKHQD